MADLRSVGLVGAEGRSVIGLPSPARPEIHHIFPRLPVRRDGDAGVNRDEQRPQDKARSRGPGHKDTHGRPTRDRGPQTQSLHGATGKTTSFLLRDSGGREYVNPGRPSGCSRSPTSLRLSTSPRDPYRPVTFRPGPTRGRALAAGGKGFWSGGARGGAGGRGRTPSRLLRQTSFGHGRPS